MLLNKSTVAAPFDLREDTGDIGSELFLTMKILELVTIKIPSFSLSVSQPTVVMFRAVEMRMYCAHHSTDRKSKSIDSMYSSITKSAATNCLKIE